MSLDGGYIGSLDHALANLHVGRNLGLAEGLAEGRALGQDEGYRAGFSDGWQRAAAEGNQLLNEQFLRIQALARENAQLRERLKSQVDSAEVLKHQLADCGRKLQHVTAETRERIWCQRRFKTDSLSDVGVGVKVTHPGSHCISSLS